jgi:tripartite-type tricarboxylate transporter receptor subunit TctC
VRVARLQQASVAALRSPELEAALTAQGVAVVGGTSEECRELARRESARWGELARSAAAQE